jgi:hypothetical protein
MTAKLDPELEAALRRAMEGPLHDGAEWGAGDLDGAGVPEAHLDVELGSDDDVRMTTAMETGEVAVIDGYPWRIVGRKVVRGGARYELGPVSN